MLKQSVLKVREFKEVVVFVKLLHGLRVDRADLLAFKFSTAVNEIRFVFVLFTPNAVIALKRALVNVASIKELLQKLLNCHLVALFSGADKVLIVNIDGLK